MTSSVWSGGAHRSPKGRQVAGTLLARAPDARLLPARSCGACCGSSCRRSTRCGTTSTPRSRGRRCSPRCGRIPPTCATASRTARCCRRNGSGAPDDNPQLLDRTATTPFDPHYTHQDAWAAREVFRRRPERHVDVGSRITFVAGLTAFTPVTFVDLGRSRPRSPGWTRWPGASSRLPFADRSVESLSCLHVAEHIGLGRYGDPLDPDGTRKAARELERVLAPGGALYFSVPVGEPRTEFNAHRVHDPEEVVGFFPELRLAAFSGVVGRRGAGTSASRLATSPGRSGAAASTCSRGTEQSQAPQAVSRRRPTPRRRWSGRAADPATRNGRRTRAVDRIGP